VARAFPRFALNRAEEGRLFTRGGPVYIGVNRFANRVLVRAQAHAPERTGALKRSLRKIAVFTPRGMTFQVGSDLDYAEAVHEGTRRHVIRPRNGKVMAFDVGGRTVFARQVVHPGSKGDPFLRRALAEEVARGV
jgi:hypothetical protein